MRRMASFVILKTNYSSKGGNDVVQLDDALVTSLSAVLRCR
jgi:hypothetical protein